MIISAFTASVTHVFMTKIFVINPNRVSVYRMRLMADYGDEIARRL